MPHGFFLVGSTLLHDVEQALFDFKFTQLYDETTDTWNMVRIIAFPRIPRNSSSNFQIIYTNNVIVDAILSTESFKLMEVWCIAIV